MTHPTALKVFLGAQVLMLLAGPFAAMAQGTSAPFTAVSDVKNFMCDVFNWLFYFLLVFSIIFVVLGGYRYLTAAGNPEAVRTANQQLLYAAIAVAIAILAKGMPTLVGSILGTTVGSAC